VRLSGEALEAFRAQVREAKRRFFRLRLQAVERIYGGLPLHQERIETWCNAKGLDWALEEMLELANADKQVPAIGEALELEEEHVASATGFAWDEDLGCCLCDYQVKAMMKNAFTRDGFFTANKGTKGDFAEFGQVHPRLIPLGRDFPDGIDCVKGTVSGPSGRRSIVSWKFFVMSLPGQPVEAEFVFDIPRASGLHAGALLEHAILGETIGLGALRSREEGKFRVTEFEELTFTEFTQWLGTQPVRARPLMHESGVRAAG